MFLSSYRNRSGGLGQREMPWEHKLQVSASTAFWSANEVSMSRAAGPFHSLPLPSLHISSFGVICKNSQPEKWLQIMDLSSPGGARIIR